MKSRSEWLQSHIWLTASSYMTKYLCISSFIRKTFLIYDFATAAPIWISLYSIWALFFFTVLFHKTGVTIFTLIFLFYLCTFTHTYRHLQTELKRKAAKNFSASKFLQERCFKMQCHLHIYLIHEIKTEAIVGREGPHSSRKLGGGGGVWLFVWVLYLFDQRGFYLLE